MVTGSALVFVVLAVVIDIILETLWSGLNANTTYIGWSLATIFAYQHLLPLAASITLAGKLTGKTR